MIITRLHKNKSICPCIFMLVLYLISHVNLSFSLLFFHKLHIIFSHEYRNTVRLIHTISQLQIDHYTFKLLRYTQYWLIAYFKNTCSISNKEPLAYTMGGLKLWTIFILVMFTPKTTNGCSKNAEKTAGMSKILCKTWLQLIQKI